MSPKEKLLYEPSKVSSPWETLQDWFEEKGISNEDFYELMHVDHPIDIKIANKLEKVTRVPADFWINRERYYRESLVKK